MVFVVKDIIVIFRKIKTILILISFKYYFSHPEKSILNLSLTSIEQILALQDGEGGAINPNLLRLI